MSKRFAMIALVLVVVCMLGVVAYADTVIPCETVDHECKMYYNEDGVAVWPDECVDLHSVYELRKGDKILLDNGVFGTIVGLGIDIDIPEWVVEKGIFNSDGSCGPNYEEYKDELEGIPYSTSYLTVQYDTNPGW